MSFFKAAGALVKIGLSLKSNHHLQFKLAKSVKRSVQFKKFIQQNFVLARFQIMAISFNVCNEGKNRSYHAIVHLNCEKNFALKNKFCRIASRSGSINKKLATRCQFCYFIGNK